ncbi:hypothetical protein WG68_10170 [Arsukibacterium ikkense]|uniref:CYTH domain-containing protein n=1 Tax=Arsukibacterium ikkense TaxID=336831 RepID=A0A0M2V3H5_9GAMM|nr:CYTH domain-containing protein [Arsukibacterium ikkense]KKO45412.1 hypothetical protein WG68_10170 [Arsukibacterium ikkense]
MSLELELKFLLAAPQSKPLARLLRTCGELKDNGQAALLNAYFDTPDNWFRRHDMGLRTRQKRGRFEQTIKLAGQQHGALQARPEFNLPAAGIVPELAAFPVDIWPEQTDVGRLQRQLTELFRTDFIRQSWQLSVAGTVLEVVYDSGQIVLGDNVEIIAELELELLTGSATTLFAVAEQLVQQLPLRTGWLSKAARGYLLADKQQLTPPLSQQSGLIGNLTALQCTEALYYRQAAAAGTGAVNLHELRQASHFLQRLSEELAVLQYADFSRQALLLAEQLQQGVIVFEQPRYNQLLLALAGLLLQQSGVAQG